jgi:hypothetical protein
MDVIIGIYGKVNAIQAQFTFRTHETLGVVGKI